MRGGIGSLACVLAVLSSGALAAAETAQQGSLRVSFTGALKPKKLPRSHTAPVTVRLGGDVSTTDGTDPPGLGAIEIAINREGQIDPAARPTCRLEQIQPATTAYARKVCGAARVGEGTFSASVSNPEQAPYPSQGIVTAFNGIEDGRPVILVHVYGTEPIPTSFTLPLTIGRAHGRFGTVLRGELPSVDVHIGFVTGLSLQLEGAGHRHARPYLAAGCPAPEGFAGVAFPLVRASFSFTDGRTLRQTLVRSCVVRG
jgi:hypothetical protein